jgi:hypothetical protein
MSYTREQAEEVIKDWNVYQDYENKLYTVDKEFLNHKFGQQLEVGKWYKNDSYNSKVCYQGNGYGFGTWRGKWGRSWGINSNNWQLMTNEEVHDFLKSECEKIFKVGDVVKNLCSFNVYEIQGMEVRVGYAALFLSGVPVLDLTTGEWAQVVKKDPIAEQIEKLEKELETLKKQIK